MEAGETVSRAEEPQGSLMWVNCQDTLKGQGFVSLDDMVFPCREYRKQLFSPLLLLVLFWFDSNKVLSRYAVQTEKTGGGQQKEGRVIRINTMKLKKALEERRGHETQRLGRKVPFYKVV